MGRQKHGQKSKIINMSKFCNVKMEGDLINMVLVKFLTVTKFLSKKKNKAKFRPISAPFLIKNL